MSGEIHTNLTPQIDVSDVVDILVNMFGEIMDRGAIAAVVESYNGDLDQSTEAILKLSEDVQALRPIEQQPLPLHPNMLPLPWPRPNPPNRSYSMVSKQPAPPSKGPIKTANGIKAGHPLVWTDQLKNIITYHNKGYKTLILMRGVSGAGKTYLSNAIVEITVGAKRENHVFSADDYFQKDTGYDFNPAYLEAAHKSAKMKAYQALHNGVSPVIIDNTNTQLWEMEPYVYEGVKNGYIIELVEPATSWVRDAYRLASRNTHGVTLQKVRMMLDRYEHNLTGDIVINKLRLSYPQGKNPPNIRNIPPFEPVTEKPEDRIGVTLTADNVDHKKSEETTVEKKNEITESFNEKLSEKSNEMTSFNNEFKPSEVQIITKNDDSVNEQSPQIDENAHPMLPEQKPVCKNISEQEIESLVELAATKIDFENADDEGKVLAEWDSNGEWEKASDAEDNHNEPAPKHQRLPKRDFTKCNSDINLLEHQTNDWRYITSYLPPWNSDMPSTTTALPLKKDVKTISEGTNTEAGDSNTHKTIYKVIRTECRDINKYHLPESNNIIPDVRKLDKSTMTLEPNLFNEGSYRCKNEEKHFLAIRSMFKTIARSDLRDIFEYCRGDPNWTVSCILDNVNTNILTTHNEEVSDCEDIVDDPCDCIAKYDVIPYVGPTEEEINPADDPVELKNEVSVSNRKKRRTKGQNGLESNLLLKKQLEESVSISGAHYSPQTLKLRNERRGRACLDNISAISFNTKSDDKDISPLDHSLENASINNISSENHESDNEMFAMSDSDIEMSSDYDEKEQDTQQDEENKQEHADLTSEEKTVFVGYELIKGLDKLFNKDLVYPNGVLPLITMPMSLINEIYALWMESLSHQLTCQEEYGNMMVKEDEEFARQLAAKEEELAREGKEPEVPDFKEIMDMDFALSIYQKETAGWRNKEPTDLASIMSRDKLYNLFPDKSKETLSEILLAYNNDFQTTVEDLLSSTGRGDILQRKDGVNKFIMEGELARQTRVMEEQRENQANNKWPVQTMIPPGEELTLATVFEYRQQAQDHLKWRNYFQQKAMRCLGSDKTGTAGYYSSIAKYHKQQFDYSNHLAATALIQVHAQTTAHTSLDLHYMFVAEAVEAIDLFVDHHIQVVRSSRTGRREHVFIVTGRGIHSQGKPKIKPAAISRLKQRGFDIVELNPGLLAIELRSSSRLTSELKKNDTKNK